MSDLLYRPCAGLCVTNDKGKILVGERLDRPGAWQMPQGGIDPGESVEEAAWRELAEEVGLGEAHTQIVKIMDSPVRYDLPADMIARLWNGRYKGQEQFWVHFAFTGDDSDIRLDGHDPPEFSAWQWVSPAQSLDLIVPFKQDTYRQVFKWLAN